MAFYCVTFQNQHPHKKDRAREIITGFLHPVLFLPVRFYPVFPASAAIIFLSCPDSGISCGKSSRALHILVSISRSFFPVIALVRLMSLFYPKSAVFLIKPCTDSFFLPLLQMPELFICSEQLAAHLFMIFRSDSVFPLFSFLQAGMWGGLLSASL